MFLAMLATIAAAATVTILALCKSAQRADRALQELLSRRVAPGAPQARPPGSR